VLVKVKEDRIHENRPKAQKKNEKGAAQILEQENAGQSETRYLAAKTKTTVLTGSPRQLGLGEGGTETQGKKK